MGVGLLSLLSACSGSAQSDLDKVHSSIEARYENIAHLNAQEFAKLDKNNVVIFDVRKPEEYAVSHIEGAVRIDPDMSADDFLTEFAPEISGRDIVFYCSVGERSSRMASRVKGKIPNHIYNLEKGLFGWHNNGRALVRSEIQTDLIHPYDEKWGRLINQQDKVSYSPN